MLLSVTLYLSWTLLVLSPAQFLPIRAFDSHPHAKEATGPVTFISEGARLARRLPQQSECSVRAVPSTLHYSSYLFITPSKAFQAVRFSVYQAQVYHNIRASFPFFSFFPNCLSQVWTKLSSLVEDEDALKWLKDATAPVVRQ